MFRKMAIATGILLGGPLGAGLGMGLANRYEIRFFVLEALGAVAGAVCAVLAPVGFAVWMYVAFACGGG